MLNDGLATILISLSLQDLCDALSGSSFFLLSDGEPPWYSGSEITLDHCNQLQLVIP